MKSVRNSLEVILACLLLIKMGNVDLNDLVTEEILKEEVEYTSSADEYIKYSFNEFIELIHNYRRKTKFLQFFCCQRDGGLRNRYQKKFEMNFSFTINGLNLILSSLIGYRNRERAFY